MDEADVPEGATVLSVNNLTVKLIAFAAALDDNGVWVYRTKLQRPDGTVKTYLGNIAELPVTPRNGLIAAKDYFENLGKANFGVV